MSLTPEELREKISEARAKETPVSAAGPDKASMSSDSSKALRMGTDYAAAVIVGAVLGFWLDRWLGTKPWGMIIFLFLGFVAGFINVYRAQTGKKTD